MNPTEKLSALLGAESAYVEELSRQMAQKSGRGHVIESVWEEMQRQLGETYTLLGLKEGASREEVQNALMEAVTSEEKTLRAYINGRSEGQTEFDKAAIVARSIAQVGRGLFLKKECGEKILKERPPESVIKFLGCRDVDEMLSKHEVTEIFSALRFMETDEWMHETFDAAYGSFTKEDFEERDIEIRVLPAVWQPVAEEYVAKKHHNVSHLKEFGVIFLNPIREEGAGKFMRDFALIFHYFHEIDFYSSLFRTYIERPGFADKFKMLLRGDVRAAPISDLQPPTFDGEWLIVQQYLWKINPKDPRLFMARVNPESVHWFRGQRDLANFSADQPQLKFGMWKGMDWVAKNFGGNGESDANLVSFDIEDSAMTTATHSDGKNESLFYHQREALWTKLFIEYAGGEDAMQKLLVENFDKGAVQL
jgi:hypothetical protein